MPLKIVALETSRSHSAFLLLVPTVKQVMQARVERAVSFGPHSMSTRLQRRARERSREEPEHLSGARGALASTVTVAPLFGSFRAGEEKGGSTPVGQIDS